jgi:uncharacterized membrane protein YqiK
MSSKGQIGLMETIMVLVVIVILIIGGIVFYFKAFGGKIEETKEELSVQEFSVLLNSLGYLPEFQCSGDGYDDNCIDIIKLYSAKNVIDNNKGYYFDKFGYKKIYFEQIYPRIINRECSKENFIRNEECDRWTIYNNVRGEKRIGISTPVSLYLQTKDEYVVGKLVVET